MRLEKNPGCKWNSKRKVQQLGTLGHFSFFSSFFPQPLHAWRWRQEYRCCVTSEQSNGSGKKARLIYNLFNNKLLIRIISLPTAFPFWVNLLFPSGPIGTRRVFFPWRIRLWAAPSSSSWILPTTWPESFKTSTIINLKIIQQKHTEIRVGPDF